MLSCQVQLPALRADGLTSGISIKISTVAAASSVPEPTVPPLGTTHCHRGGCLPAKGAWLSLTTSTSDSVPEVGTSLAVPSAASEPGLSLQSLHFLSTQKALLYFFRVPTSIWMPDPDHNFFLSKAREGFPKVLLEDLSLVKVLGSVSLDSMLVSPREMTLGIRNGDI